MSELRSSAKTIGAMCGNDMLDRAVALVVELRVPPRLRNDAAHEAVLAELEERNPEEAVRRFVSRERSMGLTGGGTRPTVLRITPDECDHIADDSASLGPSDGWVDAAANRFAVAGAVLIKLTHRQRKMLVLAALDWTHEEIAQHLGIQRENVTAALTKIHQRSQAMLTAHNRT